MGRGIIMLLRTQNLFIFFVIAFTANHYTHADANKDIKLRFGVYASEKPTTVVGRVRPVLNVIESELSQYLKKPVKIKTQVMSSYEKGVSALVNGKVDFSRFGPASYIKATTLNPDISILAMEHKGGKKVFYGIICVAENSPINSIEDLKGKRFAFGNENSTIGRFLSQKHLMNYGISASDLLDFKYLGRHDKVGTSVALGMYDAGALKESTFKKLVKNGKKLRAIGKLENVTMPWIARSGLPKDVYLALQHVMLNLKNTAPLKKSFNKDGFLPGTNADYALIRQAIAENPVFFE